MILNLSDVNCLWNFKIKDLSYVWRQYFTSFNCFLSTNWKKNLGQMECVLYVITLSVQHSNAGWKPCDCVYHDWSSSIAVLQHSIISIHLSTESKLLYKIIWPFTSNQVPTLLGRNGEKKPYKLKMVEFYDFFVLVTNTLTLSSWKEYKIYLS